MLVSYFSDFFMRSFFLFFRLAIGNLSGNYFRTILTLLGVVVSVIAIILVLTVGESVKAYVISEVESFGTDVIQVEIKVPATSKTSSENAGGIAMGVQITTLTLDDAEALLRHPNVLAYNAGILGQSLAQYRGDTSRVTLLGSSFDAPVVDRNLSLSDGSFFSRSQESSLAQVVVLGFSVAEELFPDGGAVGEKLRLRGQTYRVVGVLEERGSTGFFSFDDVVYVPITTMQKKILGVDYLSYVTFRVSDEKLIDQTAQDLSALLRLRHDTLDPSEEDFAVSTIQEARDTLESVFGSVNILLLALASVSLLVGGVGIMNVMLVSVSERITEIGLRKALGARRRDVLGQFLIESLVVGFLGGFLGVLLGLSLLFLAMFFLRSSTLGLSISIPFFAPFIGVVFSLIAGIVFGVYPAWRASAVSPIAAIRKE